MHRSLSVPVLDQEPAIWPDDLFHGDPASRLRSRWCVYHVRPRAEKVLARYLRSRQVSYFLPQSERQKRYQRRLVRSYLVLFPGYVFALINDQNVERTFGSKAIIRSLEVDDQEQFLATQEDEAAEPANLQSIQSRIELRISQFKERVAAAQETAAAVSEELVASENNLRKWIANLATVREQLSSRTPA